MERKLHFLESFSAKGTDGAPYKVLVYEHMARDESVADGTDHWESTGELEFRLEGGERLEVHKDGSMRLARSGVQLYRAEAEHTLH
jgi:hypothetical protein